MDSNDLTLEEMDVDNAISESFDEAVDTSGLTRGAFLKRFAVGAGGLAVAGSVLAPAAAMGATRKSATEDLAILNYALTLEYLEAAFYSDAIKNGKLNKVNYRFANVVGAHETAHVKAITATIKQLGGTPVAKPKFNFKQTNRTDAIFMKTSLALEETGVPAFLGQVDSIMNPAILIAATRIATVEARHAAWMRNIMGVNPAPNAFDGRRSRAKTLEVVGSTGFLG